MEQNQNLITLELNLKVQMKDYRVVIAVKRAWITALIVVTSQFINWLIQERQ